MPGSAVWSISAGAAMSEEQPAGERGRKRRPAQDAVDDRAPDATLVVVATKTVDERHAQPLDVVAQLGEDRRQHRQRADHGDGDHDHRGHSEGRESVPGEEHARHGDDDRRAGDEHRASGCRGGYLERLLGLRPAARSSRSRFK